MPKVSVIVPNYNHAEFLEQRIESILAQSYRDFEIICLDDGSTDESKHIIRKYSNAGHVRAVLNENNSGSPFKQWNRGIRLAQGEYVWIAESDDCANPNFLAEVVAVLNNNPSVGIAYCYSPLIDQLNNAQDWPAAKRSQTNFVASGKDECRNFLLSGNSIPNASAALIRRSVLHDVGYADESMRFCGDWLTWVKVLLVSDIAFVAEPLSYFRIHSGSVSARLDRTLVQVEERYRVVQYIVRNIDVPRNRLSQVCDAMMSVWLEVFFAHPSREAWGESLAIFRVASSVDPIFHAHLIKRLLTIGLSKVGLLKLFRMLKHIIIQPASY